MRLLYSVGVQSEIGQLPHAEREAMLNALDKLAILGKDLGYPHTSQIKSTSLRELRPRAGRSPWRALYQRHGDVFLIAGICPEAQHDPRRFQRAIATAMTRLDTYKSGEVNHA